MTLIGMIGAGPQDAFALLEYAPVPGGGWDHGDAFRIKTLEEGKSASGYFEHAGVRDFARARGGICALKMDGEHALYQARNVPLVSDDDLSPSTSANRQFFGDFFGSLPNDAPERPTKRAIVEETMGSERFMTEIERSVIELSREFLHSNAAREIGLDEFALHWVAHVDSFVPGLLDLHARPLNLFLDSPQHGRLVRNFFDVASEVISKSNPDAAVSINMIVPFLRELLLANINSIAAAPESNLVKAYFHLWGLPLDAESILALDVERLKELGTIVVATFDTTALSLLWALAFIGTSSVVQHRLVEAAHEASHSALSDFDIAVLEAVRLGGSNPTALWRRTVRAAPALVNGRECVIPAGVRIWLDRRAANVDPDIFPNPEHFDLNNIRSLVRTARENSASLISRNRYEINSFSMINSHRNPRKCPGRLYAVRVQALLLHQLFREFDVVFTGIDISLRDFTSMPKPQAPGYVLIKPKLHGGRC